MIAPTSGPGLLATVPEDRRRAVLALGANLGDRAATLQDALTGLHSFEGLRVSAVSPVFETPPVGGPEQPDFLNAVALVDTFLSPLDLLAACQQVEHELGRVREVRWGPRTLDVDVISYAGVVAATEQLCLPHPRAALRAFVLAPWAALDPSAELVDAEGGHPVADLLPLTRDAVAVRRRDDIRLVLPG